MQVVIRRSARRKKTISARMQGDVLEITAPEDISESDLESHIKRLQKRLERRLGVSKRDDLALERRACYLNKKYFDGALRWKSICYSTRQERRRGSCTPVDRTIRISDRLREMPRWVEDYVIVHELAHLLEPNHGRQFKSLVNRYPLAERARGFLLGFEMAQRRKNAP